MNKYKIIADEQKLRDFIDNFLPEISGDETFYCTLFARKKYWPTIKADKGQLKRFVSPKHRIIDKIRQLECEVGSYTFEGHVIPNEALCCYITPNPRSNKKATLIAIRKLADLLAYDNKDYNLHQEILSCVQQAKSRTVVLDFDFDCDEMPNLEGIVNPSSYRVCKTRGGFHILVRPELVEPEYKHSFHKKLSSLPGCDVKGDCLLPIPGTYQGGHVVELLEPNYNIGNETNR